MKSVPDRRLLICFFLLWLLLSSSSAVCGNSDTPSQDKHGVPSDPLTDTAFEHFYNMEYDRATQEFERIVEKHPDDAFAVNHLLTAVLMHDLYDTGSMNTGDYANDSFIGRPRGRQIRDQGSDQRTGEARAEPGRAAIEKKNSNDVNALYCRGVTRAQFAVYTGLVERAWFSALRNAVGARHDHERVLELDPAYTDAKLVVGTHNYVVGNLPWSVKVAAAIAGLSGSRDKVLPTCAK